MIRDVNSCLDNVPTDSGCLIIRGSKGMFSAGFDLKVIGSGDVDAIKSMSKSGFEMLSRILDFPETSHRSLHGPWHRTWYFFIVLL